MPKRIVNRLETGLPSKIYFLAYSGPKTGYEIASKIYGRKYPPTSKVYSWTKKMTSELAKTEKGFISKVDPLLAEIESALQKNHGIELSQLEKRILYKFLDSSGFRRFVESANCNVPLDQDLNSAQLIMGTLGLLATAHLQNLALANYLGKKTIQAEPKSLKEFEETVKTLKIQFERMKNFPPPQLKKAMLELHDAFRELMPGEAKSMEARMRDWDPERVAYLYAMPKELLLKLQKLYPMSELTHSLMVWLLGEGKIAKWLRGGRRTCR